MPRKDLHLYESSGLTVIKTTVGGYEDSFDSTVRDMKQFQQVFELYPDVFMQVRRIADFAIAKREKKLGVLLLGGDCNARGKS